MPPKKRSFVDDSTSASAAKRQHKSDVVSINVLSDSTAGLKETDSDDEFQIEIQAFSPLKQSGIEYPISYNQRKSEEISGTIVASKHSEITPMRHSTTHASNIALYGTNADQALKDRKADAQRMIDTYLTRDIDGIIDLAAPKDEAAKQKADLAARSTANLLDNIIASNGKLSNRTHSSYYKQFAPWINMNNSSKRGAAANERAMYAPISAFICCVAHLIQAGSDSSKESTRSVSSAFNPSRLLIPSERSDTTCIDADDKTRIDIGIMLQDISKPAQINKQQLSKSDKGKKINGFDYSQVWYKDLFAVIEVKHKATAAEFNNAYVQLFMYTRNLYATQPNRRFAWGLVICGTMVEACVFGPNYAVASKKMDISTAEGRHEFVKLLTYWSFSEDYRLGYDPTMRRLKGLGCWEIEVPVCGDGNSKSNKTKVYYSNLMVTIAERLFGRHTRCFLATPDKPAIGKLLTVDDYSIFIKDAWPEADEDCSKDTRDEIRHLAKIKRMLGDKRPELEGMYPTIEAGGRVCIKHTGANSKAMLMQDTTRAILGDILEQSKATEMRALDTGKDNKDKDENAQMEQIVHVRVHKRIATTPIGQPISKAKSVFELLVIFADIMKCHNAVYKECNILHRDISMNNIMFRRTRDGVAGLLIDFDHSKDEEFDNGTVHDMRTGTMPFMSINNLENNSTRRTVLDDWESFIYILCWIGTYGYNSKTRRKYVSTYPLRIRHWVTDNMEANADAKRRSLEDQKNFSQITEQFDKDLPGYDVLIEAVHYLRDALVNSEIVGVPHGTMIVQPLKYKIVPKSRRHLSSKAIPASSFTTPTKGSSSTKANAPNKYSGQSLLSPIPSMQPRQRPAGVSSSADSDKTDPIALRVQYASEISETLTELLEDFVNQAINLDTHENI